MGQLSFFSAENEQASLTDLTGVLAAQGQSVSAADGARISVVLRDDWRVAALVDEISRCGIDAQVGVVDDGGDLPVVRTETTSQIAHLVDQWTKGAVKSMPPQWIPSVRALRLWVIVAGRRDGNHYLLGLDPRCPESHTIAATAMMRAGVAPTLVGAGTNHPGLRVTGRRRLMRLREFVGDPPAGETAAQQWPPAFS